jgi:hypothetical protein
MFNTFTFKALSSLALIAAVAIAAAGPVEAGKKNKIPGHWERGQDGGFEWVGKKKNKPKNVQPVVRDHRNGSGGGGVTVTETGAPIVRDHRTEPVVRDHRAQPEVRDHRKKKLFGIPGF